MARPQETIGGYPVPQYFTLKQGAALAGMSYRQLYQRVARDEGPPAVKRGHFFLLPVAEFMVWASQKVIP